MNHSAKLMWGCLAIVALAVVLAVALTTPYYLLVALPCVLMIGAMLWMMRGGMGDGSGRRGRQ